MDYYLKYQIIEDKAAIFVNQGLANFHDKYLLNEVCLNKGRPWNKASKPSWDFFYLVLRLLTHKVPVLF